MEQNGLQFALGNINAVFDCVRSVETTDGIRFFNMADIYESFDEKRRYGTWQAHLAELERDFNYVTGANEPNISTVSVKLDNGDTLKGTIHTCQTLSFIRFHEGRNSYDYWLNEPAALWFCFRINSPLAFTLQIAFFTSLALD